MMKTGILTALGSAILFGASTPLAKLLVGSIDPWLMAGLLYLGSGIGLALYRLVIKTERAGITGIEWVWLTGAIVSGGIIAPVLLMVGLSGTSGSTASLLLNAEGVLTALLAWFVFKENFDRRIAVGMVSIMLGALILSWTSESTPLGSLWGPLCILGACLCWGLDNNLTRKVSLSDPVQIASLKGLVAGTVNTTLALVFFQAQFPSQSSLFAALLLGLLGYGVSLVLFVVSLRYLGSARSGAYFSTAPFVGAIIAILFLGEEITIRFVIALTLMGMGVVIHLVENHEHDHQHEPLDHDHVHTHDDQHHDHDHPQPFIGQHSHPHRHHETRHAHRHYPDSHHRHGH